MPSFSRLLQRRINDLRSENGARVGGIRNVSGLLQEADENLSRFTSLPLPTEGPLGRGAEDIRRVQRRIRQGRRALDILRRARSIGDLIRFSRGGE